jgi:hypothetical protein
LGAAGSAAGAAKVTARRWVEINVGVENLAELRGGGAAADVLVKRVGGDDAGEGENAGREGHVGLVEADGVQAVGAAGGLGCDALGRRYCNGQECGAGDSGPDG